MRLRFLWLVSVAVALGFEPVAAQENLATVHHRFRIFLHPDLARGIEPARLNSLLGYYVEDLNTIFAKNTQRRFDFNPATDLLVTDSPPAIGYYPGDPPEEDYEVWAVVNPSSSSYGGYMSYATNGAGVAAGLYWDAVHDRTLLSNSIPGDWNLRNYWLQIHHLAHELGHVFGAAVGEYYNLRYVQDNTGESPVQNLEYYGYHGTDAPFWSEHADYWSDPMLMWLPELSWGELIGRVRFAEVTAAMIDRGYRRAFPVDRYVPDLSSISVQVTSGTGQPIPQTLVKVWKVMAHSPYSAQLIASATTSADGVMRFAWNAGPNNEDNLILIKAWPPTLPPMTKWFSLYDAQEAKLISGKTNLVIPLHPWTPSPPSLAIQSSWPLLTLSWPTAAGFTLEGADRLENPVWHLLTNSPVQQGLTNVLHLPTPDASRFYRLRRTWAN